MDDVINMWGNGIVMYYYIGMDIQTCEERQKSKREEKEKEKESNTNENHFQDQKRIKIPENQSCKSQIILGIPTKLNQQYIPTRYILLPVKYILQRNTHQ
jgi:lipoprotein NlpI